MPKLTLLLLTERSAELWPKMLQEVVEAVQRIREREQVTILMVEQNAMEALRISDRAHALSMDTAAPTGRAQALMHDEQVREPYPTGRAG